METRYGENLEFQETVLRIFTFLEKEYDYVVSFQNDNKVIYSKKGIKRIVGIKVVITIDPPLQSVQVDFHQYIDQIGLGAILRSRSPNNTRFAGLHASTHDILVKRLQIIARLMKEHASDILDGDKKAFNAVYEETARMAVE